MDTETFVLLLVSGGRGKFIEGGLHIARGRCKQRSKGFYTTLCGQKFPKDNSRYLCFSPEKYEYVGLAVDDRYLWLGHPAPDALNYRSNPCPVCNSIQSFDSVALPIMQKYKEVNAEWLAKSISQAQAEVKWLARSKEERGKDFGCIHWEERK